MNAQSRPHNSHVTDLKVPPHSIEAEQAVLGGLMLDNRAWERIADKITADDFFRREHQLIFKCVAELAEEAQPFDVVTVVERLERHGDAGTVGGLAYVGGLVHDTPSAANVAAYANAVRERSIRRQMISIGGEIADAGFNPEGRDWEVAVSDAVRALDGLGDQDTGDVPGWKAHLTQGIQAIDEGCQQGDNYRLGLDTGLIDLDEAAPIVAGDLYAVLARPSMGKTALALTRCQKVLRDGGRVMFFAQEGAQNIALRMKSSMGRINYTVLRKRKLSDEDWPRLTSAVAAMSQWDFILDGRPRRTHQQIRSACAKAHREKPLSMIVVDHMHIMGFQGQANREDLKYAEITGALKALAVDLNVPVMLLGQLNRALEQRPNKRPNLADIREAGSLEQDADVVQFIYRDEQYNEDTLDAGIAEVITAKQREGEAGVTTRLSFRGQFVRFENLSKQTEVTRDD